MLLLTGVRCFVCFSLFGFHVAVVCVCVVVSCWCSLLVMRAGCFVAAVFIYGRPPFTQPAASDGFCCPVVCSVFFLLFPLCVFACCFAFVLCFVVSCVFVCCLLGVVLFICVCCGCLFCRICVCVFFCTDLLGNSLNEFCCNPCFQRFTRSAAADLHHLLRLTELPSRIFPGIPVLSPAPFYTICCVRRNSR